MKTLQPIFLARWEESYIISKRKEVLSLISSLGIVASVVQWSARPALEMPSP